MRKLLLENVFTLQKYIFDTNKLFARKPEDMLTSFGHQSRLEDLLMMETPHFTDYFSHKYRLVV